MQLLTMRHRHGERCPVCSPTLAELHARRRRARRAVLALRVLAFLALLVLVLCARGHR